LKFINSLFSNFLGKNKKVHNKKQIEFEELIQSISKEFTPEPISDEKELQGQLTVFLKTRFPQKNICREVSIGRGNRVDIVVQGRFAFELKVPRNRIDLRDLESQLSEYAETYQNICAVILILEPSLLEIAHEYADKYQANCNAKTIILGGVVKRNHNHQKRRKSHRSVQHQKLYSTCRRRDTKADKIVQGIQKAMKIMESFSQSDTKPIKNQSIYKKNQDNDPFGINKFADSFSTKSESFFDSDTTKKRK